MLSEECSVVNCVNYTMRLSGASGLCFILNVVSSTSNLGYAPSRVCVCCTTRANSSGLIGSVMTKAISIETALLAGLLAGLLAD